MKLEPPRCPSHGLRLVSTRDCQRSPSNVRHLSDDVRPSMSISCALAFSASPRKLNTTAPLDDPFHAASLESQLRARKSSRTREWRCVAWRTRISSPSRSQTPHSSPEGGIWHWPISCRDSNKVRSRHANLAAHGATAARGPAIEPQASHDRFRAGVQNTWKTTTPDSRWAQSNSPCTQPQRWWAL